MCNDNKANNIDNNSNKITTNDEDNNSISENMKKGKIIYLLESKCENNDYTFILRKGPVPRMPKCAQFRPWAEFAVVN